MSIQKDSLFKRIFFLVLLSEGSYYCLAHCKTAMQVLNVCPGSGEIKWVPGREMKSDWEVEVKGKIEG